MFLHIGRRMIDPSIDNARPAPLDIQTENVSKLRPANFGSEACLYLEMVSIAPSIRNPEYLRSEAEHCKVTAMKEQIEEQLRTPEVRLHEVQNTPHDAVVLY